MVYYVNTRMNKNHIVTSINAEIAFEKIKHPLVIRKILDKVALEGIYLSKIKATFDKLIANSILNVEKLKV